MKRSPIKSLSVTATLFLAAALVGVSLNTASAEGDGETSTCGMVNQMTFSSEFLTEDAGKPTVEEAADSAIESRFMERTDDSGGHEVISEDSEDASVVVRNRNGDGSAIIALDATEDGDWTLHMIAQCVDGAFSESEYLLAPSTTTKWYTAVWPGGSNVSWVLDNSIASGRHDAYKAGMNNYSDRAGGNGPNFNYQGTTAGTNDGNACGNNNNKIYEANGLEELGALGVTSKCIVAPDLPGDEPKITKFQVTFEESPTQGWYAGTDSPGTKWDLRSIATHEAGHVTGFYGHFADDSDRCPKPRTSATATMCPGAPGIRGTTWLRTLEAADISAINAAY